MYICVRVLCGPPESAPFGLRCQSGIDSTPAAFPTIRAGTARETPDGTVRVGKRSEMVRLGVAGGPFGKVVR